MYLGTDYLLCFHPSFQSSHSGGSYLLFSVLLHKYFLFSAPRNSTGVRGWAFWKGSTKEIQSPFLNPQPHHGRIKNPELEETHEDHLRCWNKLWETRQSSGTRAITMDSRNHTWKGAEKFWCHPCRFGLQIWTWLSHVLEPRVQTAFPWIKLDVKTQMHFREVILGRAPEWGTEVKPNSNLIWCIPWVFPSFWGRQMGGSSVQAMRALWFYLPGYSSGWFPCTGKKLCWKGRVLSLI